MYGIENHASSNPEYYFLIFPSPSENGCQATKCEYTLRTVYFHPKEKYISRKYEKSKMFQSIFQN